MRSRVAGALTLALSGCGRLEPPVLAEEQEPLPYPFGAWYDGVEGEVEVRVLVNADGAVDSVALLEGSGAAALDSAALAGAGRLLFHPAQRGGEAVPAWVVVPVLFERGADGIESEAGVEGDKTGVERDEAGAENDETGVGSGESGIGSGETGVTGVESDEDGVRSDETGVGRDEVGVESDEAGVESDEAGIGSDEDGVGEGEDGEAGSRGS